MPNVTFLDTPGRLYDLYFLFILNFNKDIYLSDNTNIKRNQEEVSYYKALLESFPSISEDLRLFFQFDTSGNSLITRFYFDKKIPELVCGNYTLSSVRQELTNIPQVTENILLHYLPDLREEDRTACHNSIVHVNKAIKNSSHTAEIKAALYDFFTDPDSILRRLSDELLEKSFLLEQDCNRNHRLYHDLRDSFDFNSIQENLSSVKNGGTNLSSFENVYVFFCTYAKSIICTRYTEGAAVLILGSNYINILADLQNGKIYPDLKAFGQAISDTNRVSILDLIDKRGKISAKDVEQELELSAPNAYYHLSLMIKSGLLSATNVGKSVFYSINGEYIRSLKRRLDCYLDKKERM